MISYYTYIISCVNIPIFDSVSYNNKLTTTVLVRCGNYDTVRTMSDEYITPKLPRLHQNGQSTLNLYLTRLIAQRTCHDYHKRHSLTICIIVLYMNNSTI